MDRRGSGPKRHIGIFKLTDNNCFNGFTLFTAGACCECQAGNAPFDPQRVSSHPVHKFPCNFSRCFSMIEVERATELYAT